MSKLANLIITAVLLLRSSVTGYTENNTGNTFFPINENVQLIYETSFGTCTTKYTNKNNNVLTQSEGDRFKYSQELEINKEGAFVKETYQYIKIFLFINKEATYRYNKPLIRLPSSLTAGLQWHWEGVEYCNGDSTNIAVNGKVIAKEELLTDAGIFNSYKVETIIKSESGKTVITEWYAEGTGLIKAKIELDGGGLMGAVRDFLGYGTIEFTLKEIKRN